MFYSYFIIILLVINSVFCFGVSEKTIKINDVNRKIKSTFSGETLNKNYISDLYVATNIYRYIDFDIFSNAIKGLKKIKKAKKNIITIIDFSKPSLKKRFFVIDLSRKKILFSTYVMHGKNSGDNITSLFSNEINSYKSSPGFFLTENSYFGSYGYSLRLDGLEKGINDKARERAIVLHGSEHAKPVEGATRLAKSLGCPAIPKEIAKSVIDVIKGGSLIYVHTDNLNYLTKSLLI